MKLPILNLKKALIILALSAFGLFVLFFFVTTYSIAHTVKTDCQQISQESHLSCIDGLISRVNNDQYDFKTRNHYIWMLGQLSDPKALPILKSLYTREIPNREPIDEVISQYELQKAINLIEKQNNIVKKVWGY